MDSYMCSVFFCPNIVGVLSKDEENSILNLVKKEHFEIVDGFGVLYGLVIKINADSL